MSEESNVREKHICNDAVVFGDAWVGGNAQVYGNAVVSDNARVFGHARVMGNAKVRGNAYVCGGAEVGYEAEVNENAVVSGNAKVYDNALVSGKAKVCDNAVVSGNAKVRGNATVCGEAKIGGRAVLLGGKWDGSEGAILEGTWEAPGVRYEAEEEQKMSEESNVTSLKPKEPTRADLREIVMTLQNREPGAEKISVGASNFAANGCATFRVEMWGYDSWKELKAGEFVDPENGFTVSFESVGRSEKWEIEAFIEVTLNWAGHSWLNAFMQAWDDSYAWKEKRQTLVAQYRKENE